MLRFKHFVRNIVKDFALMNKQMNLTKYSIRDLEKLTGIKAHTIRIWEKRYGIVEPERTNTNIRFYSDDDLKKLLNISTLNRHGIKISRLAELSNEELIERVNELSNEVSDYDDLIESMVLSMIEIDEFKFEKLINTAILRLGFENALTKIVYPFFQKIGTLWLTGAIHPGQEHFVSNLIRQKIIVAIDGIIPPHNPNAKRYLMFLPQSELHELGLLFYSYIIKKYGHTVIYLGQSVPFEDLIRISESQKVDVLFTSFTTSVSLENLQDYIDRLAKQFSDKDIFINGLQLEENIIKSPENVKIFHNLNEFKEFHSFE